MKFSLGQLYSMNRSKPIVELYSIEGELQWDTCDLEGLPPERILGTVHMNSHGKIPKGQWDNLPELFTSVNGDTYKIEDIHSLKSS
jgi:hypothetical protein|tara:strand:+ start:852 stop:1109 length:258 start_codon:yes stop_codon:yes gene_type:complete